MNQFNIRVYGIYIQDDALLVTDEIRFGIEMTKLPGGGLKFGEGLGDGLKREWKEELNVDIEVGDIVYANPFLQVSAFNETDQVICMYFSVRPLQEIKVSFKEKPMDFPIHENDQQIFRWIPVSLLTSGHFTFPIDQALIPVLKKWHSLTEAADT